MQESASEESERSLPSETSSEEESQDESEDDQKQSSQSDQNSSDNEVKSPEEQKQSQVQRKFIKSSQRQMSSSVSQFCSQHPISQQNVQKEGILNNNQYFIDFIKCKQSYPKNQNIEYEHQYSLANQKVTPQHLVKHKQEIQNLLLVYEINYFKQWLLLACYGFSIIVHGFGSKIALMDQFINYIKSKK